MPFKLRTLAVSSVKKQQISGCFVTPSQTFSSSATDHRAPVSFLCGKIGFVSRVKVQKCFLCFFISLLVS